MKFFDELGSLIEQRWRAKNYDEDAFPEIARLSLTEAGAGEQVDAWDIIRWVQTASHLPRQYDLDARFGNPPITVFDATRFYIDVYYWLDGTTSIHRHAFSGAFQVLLGSSIHSRYRFHCEGLINEHFAIGRIDYDGSELLTRGDTREILAGDQFIHSLFHLDRPSATICVRTYQTTSALPQFDYLKPHFAIDPFFRDELSIRKVQAASLLLQMKHEEADEMIGAMVTSSDFQTAFAILDMAFKRLTGDEIERIFRLSGGRDRFQSLIEKARQRHGPLTDFILPVIEYAQRQANIIARRRYLTSPEHRFFLALILNVPDRSLILDLVKQRFTDSDPIETIAEWVKELSTTKILGSPEPNVIGVDYFDDACLLVFKRLLGGVSLEQTKAEFEKEYGSGDEGEMESIVNSFRDSILLRPLV